MCSFSKTRTRRNSTISLAMQSATQCAVAPILGRMHMELLLRGIKVISLHKDGPVASFTSYVKVYVDGHKAYETERKSHTSEFVWELKGPVDLEAFPSSEIKFSLFVCHKFRREEHIGDVVGTAWTFASQTEAYHRIDSTNLLPAMQIDLALKYVDDEDEQRELQDMMHDLDIRSIQSVKRMSMHAAHGAFAIQDQTLQTIEKVVDLLTDLSPMFQVCKIAVALVKVAQQTVQAMKEIDASIDSMWKSIREVAIKSLACSGDTPIPGTKGACRRVIDLAARSAEIVDRWVDSTTLRPFIKKQVKAQIHQCRCELQEVQDNLHFSVEVALYRATATATRIPSAPPYEGVYGAHRSRRGASETQDWPSGSSTTLVSPTRPSSFLKSKRSFSQFAHLRAVSPALSSRTTLCSDPSPPTSPERGRTLHRERSSSPDTDYGSDHCDEDSGERQDFNAPDGLPPHPENIVIRSSNDAPESRMSEAGLDDEEFWYSSDDEGEGGEGGEEDGDYEQRAEVHPFAVAKPVAV